MKLRLPPIKALNRFMWSTLHRHVMAVVDFFAKQSCAFRAYHWEVDIAGAHSEVISIGFMSTSLPPIQTLRTWRLRALGTAGSRPLKRRT